jgi:hypothetical protein
MVAFVVVVVVVVEVVVGAVATGLLLLPPPPCPFFAHGLPAKHVYPASHSSPLGQGTAFSQSLICSCHVFPQKYSLIVGALVGFGVCGTVGSGVGCFEDGFGVVVVIVAGGDGGGGIDKGTTGVVLLLSQTIFSRLHI